MVVYPWLDMESLWVHINSCAYLDPCDTYVFPIVTLVVRSQTLTVCGCRVVLLRVNIAGRDGALLIQATQQVHISAVAKAVYQMVEPAITGKWLEFVLVIHIPRLFTQHI